MSAPDSLNAHRMSKLYSVSTAAKTAGVSQRQLYYWEHLGIVKPMYEEFGSYSYRRYSQDQINLLVKIKDLLDSGYTLQAAIKKVSAKNLGGSAMYSGGKENGNGNGSNADHNQ